MGKVAAAIEHDINDHVADVYSSVLYQLIQRTPVDTGLARSNWIVGLGSVPTRVVANPYRPFKSRWRPSPALNYYDRGGSRDETGNLNPTLLLGQRILKLRRTDQPVYIANNLPYIERLNEGWSRQSIPGLIMAGVLVGFREAQTRFRFTSVERVLS